MPFPERFANEAATTLNGAITAGATSMTVTSSAGFPAAPFRVRVNGSLTAGGSGTEYLTVTAVSGTTWTATRSTEVPYNTALGFATAAVVEHVVTAIGLYASAPFVNVMSPQFGAKGDDATDDSAAIQAAVNFAATLGPTVTAGFTGGTVYFPPGVYRCATAISVPSNIRLLGSGRSATTIRRTANVNTFQFYGVAPADTGARNIYCSMEHIGFQGGDFNASLLDFVYVSQFQLDHVRVYGCGGSVLDLTEVWDSSFSNLFTDWSGSATNPAVWIRNSRATSGFGFSGDSSNQLKFLNLHCETFSGYAVKIEPGSTNTSPPNGIYFNVLKCESAQVVSGTNYIYIDQACQTIHFDKVYCSLNAFAAGSSTPIDIILNNSAGQVSLFNIEIATNAVSAMVRAGIRNNTSGSLAFTTIDGCVGIFGQAPTVGLIEVASAGGLEVDHINTNQGTLITGFQMEVQERMVALTADITTTSTTIVDATGFTFTNVLPGTYTLRFDGVYRSSVTTGGPRFGFGGTATTTTPIIGRFTQNTSLTAVASSVITSANSVGTGGGSAGTAATDFPINGWFTFTVTATGTITLRWLVSIASTQTLRGGSWAILSRNR